MPSMMIISFSPKCILLPLYSRLPVLKLYVGRSMVSPFIRAVISSLNLSRSKAYMDSKSGLPFSSICLSA